MPVIKPAAPHGYEAHPGHAVIMGYVPEIDALFVPCLAPGAARHRLHVEKRGMDRDLIAPDSPHYTLMFVGERPGVLYAGISARRLGLSTDIVVCAGGIVLPGALPPQCPIDVPAWPFCFLAGLDGALQQFASWRAWAEREGVNVTQLHDHVWRGMKSLPAADAHERVLPVIPLGQK